MQENPLPAWLESEPDATAAVLAARLLILPFESLSPVNFERLVLRLARRDADVEHAQQYGEIGQDQHGIDLYCRLRQPAASGRRYYTVQCRNVASTTATDLALAIEDFLEGAWARKTDTFIFATRVSNLRTDRAEAIEAAAARLGTVGIAFEVWDGETLSERLVQIPALVDTFFGRDAVRLHCGHDAAEQLAQAAAADATWPLTMMRRDVALLVGRDTELEDCRQALQSETSARLVVVTGAPGVGKSALAVRLSHLIADDYADGSVFLDARGRSTPVADTPDLTLLLWEAVEPAPVGKTLTRPQRISRLRAVLAGRRLLVVADDVTSEAAARELLDLSATIGVICASRSRLSGLAASGAYHLDLTPLATDDATTLAASTAGPGRLTAQEARALAEVCGGLPLAVKIAAARLARRPTLVAETYLQRLADPDQGIESLKAGELVIGPIIDESYRDLASQEAEIIRALGVLPNAAAPAHVVAAAIASSLDLIDGDLIERVQEQLDDLYELNLVDQPQTDRYRLHDVLYRFARNKARDTPESWRDAVIANACRMYALLVQKALSGIRFLDEQTYAPALTNATALKDLDDYRNAVVECITFAAHRALWDPLVLLAAAITPYLHLRSNWADFEKVHEHVREAGEHTGSTPWRSNALLNLGKAAAVRGETDQAIHLYRQCIDLTSHDDPLMAHLAFASYGALLFNTGQLTEARRVFTAGLSVWRHLRQTHMLALTLRDIGSTYLQAGEWPRGEIYLLNAQRLAAKHQLIAVELPIRRSLAALYRQTGRIDQARTMCDLALQQAQAIGDRDAEAAALLERGFIAEHEHLGQPGTPYFDAALTIFREIGDAAGLLTTYYQLGSDAASSGNIADAQHFLQQCQQLSQQTGDPGHTALAAAKLAGLAGDIGHDEQAESGFAYAEQAAVHAGNIMIMAQVHTAQARWHKLRGRSGDAAALLRKAIAILEPHGDSQPLTTAQIMLAEALVQQNRWQEANQLLVAVINSPSDAVKATSRVSALRYAAALYSRRGLWHEALGVATRALSLAQAAGAPQEEMLCRATLGTTLARMKRWPQALVEFDTAAELAARYNHVVELVSIRSNQATAEYETGQRDLALTRIRKLISLTERLNLHQWRASLHNNLGSMLAKSGEHAEAISQFDAARELAVSLGDSSIEASAQANLARSYLAHDEPAEATAAADQAWRLHQDQGAWKAAAEELLLRVRLDEPASLDDVQQTLHRLTGGGEQLTNGVSAYLRAMLTRGLETDTDGSAPETTEDPSTEASDDDHEKPAVANHNQKRRIAVAADVRAELEAADLDALTQHLSTSPSHCWACRLPIAKDGQAELMLLSTQAPSGTDVLRVCLAHPGCATSRVVVTDDMPSDQTTMDLECAFAGDGLAAIYVDCRGGVGIIDSGQLVDGLLASLREYGFSDVHNQLNPSGQTQLALPSTEPDPKLFARLVHNRLTVEADGTAIITNTPLDFYPSWYAAARRGILVLAFGRRLEGMSTDNPQSLLRAAQAGQLVAAVVPLHVIAPRRNEKCPCSPSTGLKYKRCCGQPTTTVTSNRRVTSV